MNGDNVLAQLSDELTQVVQAAGRSVVQVNARRGGPASGIVWSSEGHVLTSDHAIEREEGIKVGLPDGRSVSATLVARDPGTDLALLKADASGLAVAERADAGSTRVGQIVLAIGRPGVSGPMASFGIVTALGGAWRTARGGRLESYVRSDAILYPGFSGGPLVSASGDVIGVNSWTLSQGAGLAIPVDVAARVADALQSGGVRRAYLGIGTQPVALPRAIRDQLTNGQESGLMVVTVESGGPAERSGLLIGDVLVAVAGEATRDADDLLGQLTPDRIGQSLPVRLVRAGELRELSVTVGQRS